MTSASAAWDDRRYGAETVAGAPEPLAAFNAAGVLSAADVHTALELGRLVGEDDAAVLLATALVARGPRFGHVCLDLRTVREGIAEADASVEGVDDLPWPEDVDAWVRTTVASPLVDAGDGAVRPLRLDGGQLYLDRYWRYELRAAEALARRAREPGHLHAGPGLAGALDVVFPGGGAQRAAVEAALRSSLTVVAGGPGTGKTATIARLVALAARHTTRDGGRPPRILLAAPTGKAAARLAEELRAWVDRLDRSVADVALLGALQPVTLHRLLRSAPGSRSRFGHGASDPLPGDLVVVDEVSMVALSIMAKLLEAVRPGAHLVLVGDPDQLASVEAGSVLGDVVGSGRAPGSPTAGSIAVLEEGHRFTARSAIGAFAAAVRDGDADAALDALRSPAPDGAATSVALVEPPAVHDPSSAGVPAAVREEVLDAARAARAAAEDGDVAAALGHVTRTKVLCAHRRGPGGVTTWNAAVEDWLHDRPRYLRPAWYAGRPVLVTSNDYGLDVSNGDLGVAVAGAHGRVRVAIEGRDPARLIEPARLAAVETVHALSIHKSQGSQFDHVIVVLPTTASPILTRELLYTAVTRARLRVTVVASEAVLRAAVANRVQRGSGLGRRLSARPPASR